MCTSDLCNANDYNIHVERANRLFAEGRPATTTTTNTNNNNVGISSPNLLNSKTISSNRSSIFLLDSSPEDLSPLNLPSMNSVIGLSSSFSPKLFAQKVDSKILREGDVEREEVLWEEDNDQDESRRTPRQIRPQGNNNQS